MAKQNGTKRLTLNKETVRVLTEESLGQAAGGMASSTVISWLVDCLSAYRVCY